MTEQLTRPDALDRLLAVLDLREIEGWGPRGEDDVWRGDSVPGLGNRAYGGQVLAQAVVACGRTVDAERAPHSMHAYFLREGALDVPIDFAVERLRDGRSFSARRTHAIQNNKPILSLTVSFQEDQPGYDYQRSAPDDVPAPEDVRSAFDELGGIDHPAARWWSVDSAFELAHVGGSLFLRPDAAPSDRQMVWVRARHELPTDDRLLHRALLAYACDQVMLEPALRGAGKSWQDVGAGVPMASLDHAMWWHRDARVDDWLLFVQEAPTAQGGRALGFARVYTRDGVLVASIAQEGMVRLPA
ncbi:acyl-CoA thioesterase [Xylanimonas cellulosilytica DSM 15894]|uniref:Acyl-CoA thioesterase n=1 Tax=Xylanimonas cellulosilytica (strain DSM 15894 / JCM 12276 / CECT 5975 / KCTC 9989 / LMG 20990 / NBRC 107835 / XIL07) TaxID=446471 RepID=D1BZH4_XYLCX|nr:acyl-CoA thioesterase domain-containing protein [Xylanimonas cellulosilytica]ACZ30128.1 acyl-CoA thioesterase [Xylanimonas cellulosilytica DSM 15894]